MPPPYAVPERVPLIHITDVGNLPSILRDGGLLSHARLRELGRRPRDISYDSVQEKRARKQVPCGSGGCLHDYVPMFFGIRPPMLLPIKSGRVPGAEHDRIVHLVSWLPAVRATDVDCVFADGHGIMATTQFFTNDSDLDKIDWPLMRSKYWNDTQQDGDRLRRRQAEFLVRDFLPWQVFEHVGTFTEDVMFDVRAAFQAHGQGCEIPVSVRPQWYY